MMGIFFALACCALTFAMIWGESKWQKAVLERLDGIKEELAYPRKQDELRQARYEEEKAFAESEEGQRRTNGRTP